MKTNETLTINGCKMLKKGVKSPTGQYSPVWYSNATLVDGRKCVTIYARSILKPLPVELGKVENNTEIMTDYFESDRVRFVEGTSEFARLQQLCAN